MSLLAVLLALAAQPPRIVPGQDLAADLTVRTRAHVELTSSVGTISNVRSEGGVVHARFLPPRSHAPAVALILAVIDDGDDRSLEWLAVPLIGSDTLELETRPHARVEVMIAGRTFGPVDASASGAVKIPVLVPPGVEKAEVRIGDKAGNATVRTVDLEPPPFQRVRAAPRSAKAVAGEPFEVEVFAVKLDGSPEDAASLTLEGGVVARRDRPGIYVATVTAPRDAPKVRVALAKGQAFDVPVQPAGTRSSRGAALAGRSEWALSGGAGLVGGGTFDGAGGGAVFAQGALRLGAAPVETFAELSAALYSQTSQARSGGGTVQAQPSAIGLDVGLRGLRNVARDIDLHASVSVGLHAQHTSFSAGPGADAWAPAFGVAGGVSASVGAGRLLVELRLLATPAGTASYDRSLAGLGLALGYLFALR